MDLMTLVFGGLGIALLSGYISHMVISSRMEEQADLLDMQIRSILEAHYERIAILLRSELERRQGKDD